jgi:hypothetical protein
MTCSCGASLAGGSRFCQACGARVDSRQSGDTAGSPSLLDLARQAAEALGVDTSSPLGAAQSLRRLYRDAKAQDRPWTADASTPETADGDFWRPGTTGTMDPRKAGELFNMLVQQANTLIDQRATRFQAIRDEMLQRCAEAMRDRRR